MLKWILVIVAGVILLGLLAPTLNKLGLGRLPGDLNFRFRGRQIRLPITTTILISLLFTVIARIL
ncbi:MAG: DUF2905 domain-containing protein [Aeromicrobium sp.]|nr:DUF2905 domain-containing protein [Burkholderiales bacterium]